MKMKLRTLQQAPYGGMFVINRPDLGMVGRGTSFDMLLTNCRNYCRDNAIPTGLGFSQHLEQKICELYPDECEGADPNLPTHVKLSFDDVARGTQVLAAFKAAGSPLVPRAEAIRRSEICSRCKLCVPFARPCGGLCGVLKTAVEAVIGGYDIPFDNDLRACGVCHCFAASHVRIPYQYLEQGLNDEMRTQFQAANQAFNCWKVPGAA